KTTLAFAYARKFHLEENKKVTYYYFRTGDLSPAETGVYDKILKKHLGKYDIRIKGLDLLEEIKAFMTKKLRSEMITNFICSTTLFQSIINLLPGFGYLILLGAIVQDRIDNPEYIGVIDAPASGHAFVMMDAVNNFQNIFGSGILFDEIKRLVSILHDDNYFNVVIPTLPSWMSMNESLELKSKLEKLDYSNINILLNNLLTIDPNLDNLDWSVFPEVLSKKLQVQKQICVHHKKHLVAKVPQILSKDTEDVINQIIPYL
ncbi:MAG: hypothetical protein ACOCUH_04305, partial [Bacteriovoracia bacterium]